MPPLTRWTLLALGLVLGSLGVVAAGVVRLAARDRASLAEQFAVERQGQLEEAAHEIEAELDDIGEDLRFAAQLVQAANSAADRKRELGALLAIVKQYRMVSIYEPSGERTLAVQDPLADREFSAQRFEDALATAARTVLTLPPGAIETSRSIPADATGWFRAFATALPSGGGAIAVLVDTAPYFSKLKLVTSSDTPLVLLGVNGYPMPATDARLVRALQRDAPVIQELVKRRQMGQAGVLWLREEDALSLELGPADVVAAYSPIPMAGGRPWFIATLSSTSALRARERAMLFRLVATSAAIALCLLGFAGYVIVASRRAVAIRERLRHVDALSRLQEKTERILDNVPVGVMVLSDALRVSALNRALRQHLPGAAGQPLERAFPEAGPSVTRTLRALVDQARESFSVQSLVGQKLALFGEEGQYSVHAVPLEPRFLDAQLLLVIEDVSEVHSLASQLLQAEKLATVGVLAAGIAHEIGTPLGIIRARAELMSSKLGEEHPQTPGARVIVEQIDRVSRTIRQLLDFSRGRPADVSAVPASAIVRAVVELLGFELERRQVSLSISVPDELPPLAADPDQFQQVLVNLLLNACDACADTGQGRIEVRAHADPDKQVRFEITDNGCGIPREHLLQVFDPFFTTKKRGKGTGLGLTVAAQIVRSHGGRIELESEVGRGTRVVLRWPVVASEVADARV